MNVAGLLREPGAASKLQRPKTADAIIDGALRDVGSIREHDKRVPAGGGCTRNEFLVI